MGVDWALDATPTAVVGVLACISLTTINPVAVAVLPTWVTHWIALAVAAGGGAEWVSWALNPTSTAVVRVLACVSLTPIIPVAVAILPAWVTHWVALAVAAGGGTEWVSWALGAAPTTVHGIVVDISFAPVLWLGVAVLEAWSAGGAADAPCACGRGAGVGWALVAALAAVFDVALDGGTA